MRLFGVFARNRLFSGSLGSSAHLPALALYISPKRCEVGQQPLSQTCKGSWLKIERPADTLKLRSELKLPSPRARSTHFGSLWDTANMSPRPQL